MACELRFFCKKNLHLHFEKVWLTCANFEIDSNVQSGFIGISFSISLIVVSCKPEEFNANDTPSRSLMMSRFLVWSLASASPETKHLSLHRGVLTGYVYDRISSVIKKALQCVQVSKRERTSVVAVTWRAATSTMSSSRDKTSAGVTPRNYSPTPRLESNPSAVIYTHCVYWSNGKRDSWKLFALCAPDTSVPCVILFARPFLLVSRDRCSISSSEQIFSFPRSTTLWVLLKKVFFYE